MPDLLLAYLDWLRPDSSVSVSMGTIVFLLGTALLVQRFK